MSYMITKYMSLKISVIEHPQRSSCILLNCSNTYQKRQYTEPKKKTVCAQISFPSITWQACKWEGMSAKDNLEKDKLTLLHHTFTG